MSALISRDGESKTSSACSNLNTAERLTLIDGEKRVGTVTKVSASGIELNLSNALAASGRKGTARGAVGDFVFIDCDRAVILGRIVEVHIPERNRPALEHQIECKAIATPVGRVQLLATIQKTTQSVVRGVLVSPRLGDGVFEANGLALSNSIETALLGGVDVNDGKVPIAVTLRPISGIDVAEIALPPEKLFGRHCGIFGTTGGGKSWTLAKLISEVGSLGGKAIVFDPTGEFSGKLPNVVEYAFTRAEDGQRLVRFPSEKMTELSLFALLRPTGQSQGPTMREAIRSLRLSRALRSDPAITPEEDGDRRRYFNDAFGAILLEQNGLIQKTGQLISVFNRAASHYSSALASEVCNFNVQRLADQIINECIWPSNNQIPGTFSGKADNTLNFCNTLIVRMRAMLASTELQCLFGDRGEDICGLLNAFLKDSQLRICLISFKNVSFNHNARELLLNTIGEYLLGLARVGRFSIQPVICFLDKAHQFIGRSVGDEFNSVSLDAFGLIAKEGRKYGLTTTLATQRPRDVPQDVLSQLGTLFVHRLTNERDRETIERACGELDRSAQLLSHRLARAKQSSLVPTFLHLCQLK